MGLNEKLEWIQNSLGFFIPELILSSGIILVLTTGFFIPKQSTSILLFVFMAIISVCLIVVVLDLLAADNPVRLFGGMIRADDFSAYFKILFNVSALLTAIMSWYERKLPYRSEYYVLLLSVVLGAHLLVMSMNFVMVFLSLEMISLSSYVLTSFAFDKKSTEGSLKYFVFGSVASAFMLYGFSWLYGLSGTLDFSSGNFVNSLLGNSSPLILVAGILVLAGFLFKIAAVPMHLWSPDVYEAAPMPIVAFFSVVPKLAGIGILTKFLLAIDLFGQQHLFDWQTLISTVAIITLTFGNFSALWQQNPKRMMAYSSIAQSGFLLVGICAFLPEGLHFMLFYATAYTAMNYLVFWYLQYFENKGFTTIPAYAGSGKLYTWPAIFILTGLIALTGLPPTAGFTAKLFIFSALWEAYELSGKSILLWLLIFGLLNTVVSLFYYLKIPYFAFLKFNPPQKTQNNRASKNLLGLILVFVILYLFFQPGLLMGLINKINFVL